MWKLASPNLKGGNRRTGHAYLRRKSILRGKDQHKGPAAEWQAGGQERDDVAQVPRQPGGRVPSFLGDVSVFL